MKNWFCSHVAFLSVGKYGWYLYVHFLPRYCYRVFWSPWDGFGADRHLKNPLQA